MVRALRHSLGVCESLAQPRTFRADAQSILRRRRRVLLEMPAEDQAPQFLTYE